MHKLKAAVVGAGYLGAFHAEKLAMLPDCELVAVVDTDPDTARRVAGKHGVEALTDHRPLLGRVDTVSIAVPTRHHHVVARDFLRHDTHVLLEKPISATLTEAQELIDLATQHRRILQIGHLERFNPVILAALDGVVKQPLFIESHRLAPFNPRGTDTSVTLDLMIHDIDIILNLVAAPVRRIDASGTPVLSPDIDIVNARLQFDNGCVANVTASRVSLKAERKMRLFQHDAYVSLDFQNKQLAVYRKGEGEMYPGIPEIVGEQRRFEDSDALKNEIKAFLKAVRTNAPPVVSGEDGWRALATAMEINRQLAAGPLINGAVASDHEDHLP
jgi:predicted dehydrogenase